MANVGDSVRRQSSLHSIYNSVVMSCHVPLFTFAAEFRLVCGKDECRGWFSWNSRRKVAGKLFFVVVLYVVHALRSQEFQFANAVGCHNHFRYRNICNEYIGCVYRVSQKSKLLILRKCVNEDETIGGTWTNTISCRENEALSDFSREIFYVTIVLCLNIPWLNSSQWNYC